jgi:hypothetical protein
MKFPEKWTVIRQREPEYDESTGNYVPVEPDEVPWTGLLQQRFIDNDQTALAGDAVLSELVLLIAPGIPGGVHRRDLLRYDGLVNESDASEDGTDLVDVGDTVKVHGSPRPRRPMRGGRRPAYIAATVRHSTDMKE